MLKNLHTEHCVVQVVAAAGQWLAAECGGSDALSPLELVGGGQGGGKYLKAYCLALSHLALPGVVKAHAIQTLIIYSCHNRLPVPLHLYIHNVLNMFPHLSDVYPCLPILTASTLSPWPAGVCPALRGSASTAAGTGGRGGCSAGAG